MSWDDVAKMIAACPGPDGAAPMIRMPDQLESSIQKATDLGAIGLIFPTMRDGHQALEAARYSRFPPFGRRSSGSGQAGSVWAGVPGGYQNTFNDNMLVVVMLETLDGIINADEIAEHVWHRRRHPGQQRSVALLRLGADRPAIPVAADGEPQCDAPRRQVLGQRGRAVPHRQSAESGCAVRAERAVDGRLDAAGARPRDEHGRADDRGYARPRAVAAADQAADRAPDSPIPSVSKRICSKTTRPRLTPIREQFRGWCHEDARNNRSLCFGFWRSGRRRGSAMSRRFTRRRALLRSGFLR